MRKMFHVRSSSAGSLKCYVARVSVSRLRRGRHTLILTVADFQEVKNNENVAGILPNTRRFQASFLVP